MESAWITPLLDWIAAHPGWSSLIVVLITFSESLAVIGFFVPGVLLLFGIGALVAVGSLDLWITLVCAAFGAVAGDVVSFWLGRHFKEGLRTVWPFSRYPLLLGRGESFFQRHGGKSVLFGRFVGPIRAIVPAIAGMVGMSPLRFLIIDTLSAIAWAPAYIVPGIVFAASLGLAAAVATRLAVLLVLLIVLLWLTVWLVRRTVGFLQPRATRMVTEILNWSRGRRVIGGLATAVLDPYQSETRGLLLFALILMGVAAIVMTLMATVGPASAGLDSAVHGLMRELSTPLSDRLMSVFARMGDGAVNAAVIAAVGLWWAWRRHWPAVVHWLSAMVFGLLLILVQAVMQALLHTPGAGGDILGRPVMIAMVYGFVSVVVARELPGPWRWAPYLVASLIILASTLARLYFGMLPFSELLVTVTVAFLWMVLLGVAYRRHNPAGLHVAGTAIVALVVFSVAAVWQMHRAGEAVHHPASERHLSMTSAQWWEEGWRALPSQRVDFIGKSKQPLSIQWLGGVADITARLLQRGWSPPVPVTPANTLLWLKPRPLVGELPVLPQVHDGHYERIVLVHTPDAGGKQLVLRLWKSGVTLTDVPANSALWVGYVAYQVIKEPLIFLSLPLPGRDFDTPLPRLQQDLDGLEFRRVRQPPDHVNGTADRVRWDGTVLLIRATGAGGGSGEK
jgi:membrane protein DedA with SNARE-associated domain